VSHAALLAAALALDAIFGEPRWLWQRLPHPAVVMGRAVGWLDRRLNRGENRRAAGVLAAGALVAGGLATGWLVAALPGGPVWELLLAAILLAQKSLVQHVADVAQALRLSVADGRRAVARIVGRDTATMQTPEVARAAIESAAENLSDGVIAPAFWFLIGGLPGMLAYKAVNTADSMIGYRTERYRDFGWAAARLDDVLNWVPARLTALCIAAAHLAPGAWVVIRRDAKLHRSPNAGWPEAAMAAILGIALSGPRSYEGALRDYPFVNPDGRRDIGAAEIDAAVAALWRSWAAALGLVIIIAVA
jgi:adenosylcobinamide-phosphate synthase